MIAILLGVLIVVAGLLAFVLFRRPPVQSGDSLQAAGFVQQQIENLRVELASSLKNTTDVVNQHLQVVTAQLSSVTQQLQSNTGQVGQRLDNAARVIQDVQNKLGELGKATQEIKELGQSVSKLEEMLQAPKLRGGLGELLLEDLLKQVLPTGSYEMQYAFKNGQKVDAIIRTSGGLVPVDAKFPFENFRKMLEGRSDQEKRTAQRAFHSDVRKHVDAIATKYIRTDEGTYDFALMYIPAENIYYETIIKDDLLGEIESLHSYSIQKHVVPVSPNSFYAHLMVIALGFKGLLIEKNAKEIQQYLQRLVLELKKFSDLFETLGMQLNNAKNNFDKADKQLASFTNRLESIQASPGEDKPSQLSLLSGEH